jgi:hypothetical protein
MTIGERVQHKGDKTLSIKRRQLKKDGGARNVAERQRLSHTRVQAQHRNDLELHSKQHVQIRVPRTRGHI